MKTSMMKKILSAALCTSMFFGLTACGNNTQQQSDADGEKLKVGIVQLIDNGAFEDMRDGFIQELLDKGYGEDKVEIIYKNA